MRYRTEQLSVDRSTANASRSALLLARVRTQMKAGASPAECLEIVRLMIARQLEADAFVMTARSGPGPR